MNAGEGMERQVSLRDYFAAHAVDGILAQMRIEHTESGYPDGGPRWVISESHHCRYVAEGAYRVADAMLVAREKGVPT